MSVHVVHLLILSVESCIHLTFFRFFIHLSPPIFHVLAFYSIAHLFCLHFDFISLASTCIRIHIIMWCATSIEISSHIIGAWLLLRSSEIKELASGSFMCYKQFIYFEILHFHFHWLLFYLDFIFFTIAWYMPIHIRSTIHLVFILLHSKTLRFFPLSDFLFLRKTLFLM